MWRCDCGKHVENSRNTCPYCGRKGGSDRIAGMFFLFVLAMFALYLAPAMVVVWPYRQDDTFQYCLSSGWAWTGSTFFWGMAMMFIGRNDRWGASFTIGKYLLIPLVVYAIYRGLT